MHMICAFSSYAKEETTSGTRIPPDTPSNTSKGKRVVPAQEIICEARLTEKSPVINSGITWHVFDAILNKDRTLTSIKKLTGGRISLVLSPGNYLISASFGHVGVVKKLTVIQTRTIQKQVFIFNAGGVRLHSVYKPDSMIIDDELSFSIYANPNQKPLIIADKIQPGTLVRLGSGNYQITSHFGNYNAIVSTIVKIEQGKIIDVIIQNRAAKATFKLVSEKGGEAIADTAWSVLTTSGDTIGESNSASPSMILSEGDYVVVSRNKDRIYSREFSVSSGKNTVVEVLMRQKRMDKNGKNKTKQ
ncbi:MAG: hypothetical protein EU981_04380 [Candidatus Liberibacter ctenarytainae]|uniref:Uncharacterized protein n=1 Tax=Candidatus Liberibacter ctenarytainae TaxID=2020335 RepID=A0A937AQX8_9HYPH|nr:hypothetical protein [Candidatus Liberibacter ctenarytainae]